MMRKAPPKRMHIDYLHSTYGTAKDAYYAVLPKRRALEYMWRQASELTLPYVFPPEHISESAELETPYNSMGPAAVNSLASKLILTLLPPTGNFFRLLPYDEDVKDLGPDEMAQIDKKLSETEQKVLGEIDRQSLRVPLFEAMKFLIITGNCLIYKVPHGGIKSFSPYQYVVQRDYTGGVLRIVIRELIAESVLPEELQSLVEDEPTEDEQLPDDSEVPVYTMIVRMNEKKYAFYQEICGQLVPGSYQEVDASKLPYIPLRWTASLNSDYGRGLTEQYIGDFRRLEALSQLIVEGASVQAKTVFGLKPGSQLKIEDLEDAYNGDVIMGNLESDISTLSVNKSADFRVPMEVMSRIESRIANAYLMMAGNIRDSERTTATEIRAVAAELEATLGGTYSILASDLQIPLVALVLQDVEAELGDLTEPSIITGTSAISRERDLNNLNMMVSTIASLGPDKIAQYLNVSGYLRAVSTALGFDPSEMVRSDEEAKAIGDQMAGMPQPQPQ